MKFKIQLFLCLVAILSSCKFSVNPPGNPFKKVQKSPSQIPLEDLHLPPGFSIEVYAENVDNARSITLSPTGTLFIGTRSGGSVYALKDSTQYTLYENGNMPNGVALKNGDLYVAEVNRILKFPNIENSLNSVNPPDVVFDQYPTESHHGWKYIAFGPDGKLYVPVGAPCNVCDSDDRIFNTITRLDVDTKEMDIVQEGIRNTVGFTWHPESKNLWFSDNGRDMMGDDIPGCELNTASTEGLHFGFPFCHQGDVLDPKFGEGKSCEDYEAPVQVLGPHVAPLGIEFYKSGMFPSSYENTIFIAEHGSWNRSKKIGYRITMVKLDANNKSLGYETFIDGWLDESEDDVWGRPVDLEWMEDGSLLISDDYANAIYRVTYKDI